MRIYVSANGSKTLFHETKKITREEWHEVKRLVKAYFGWKKLTWVRGEDGICLMDAERVEKLRKAFAH
jgi:metallophosphoesterase superfamily enzyme